MTMGDVRENRMKRGKHTTTTLPLRLNRSIRWVALGIGIGMMAFID